MKFLVVFALVAVALGFPRFHQGLLDQRPAQRKEIIDSVNQANAGWTAGVNKRFEGVTIAQAKKLMGALKGGPKLPVKHMTEAEKAAAPDSFDSRVQWAQCTSMSEIRDQANCGSCWAFGAAEAMTDRLCISSGQTDQTRISAQDITSCCGFECGMGCDGGYPEGAWDWWASTGVVSGDLYKDTKYCYPYALAPCDHHMNGTLPPCPAVVPTPSCTQKCVNGAVYKNDKHKGKSAYSVESDEESIKAEIYANGPVEVAFTVYEDFLTYKSGVYRHTSGSELGGHAVKMLGWGTENGTPYWIIANSWNAEWGAQGYFKILRGSDECGIEDDVCAGKYK